MTKRRSIGPVLSCVALSIAGALVGVAAGTRPSLADGAPSAASASARAPAASSSAAPVDSRPRFSANLPPAEPSDVPTADDWKAASVIAPDRPFDTPCRLLRVREWVRFSCPAAGGMAGLIAGNADGYSAGTPIPPPGTSWWTSTTHWVQFPVRRGDRRLMQLRDAEPGNYGDGLYVTGGVFVNVTWLDGEPPRILLNNYP